MGGTFFDDGEPPHEASVSAFGSIGFGQAGTTPCLDPAGVSGSQLDNQSLQVLAVPNPSSGGVLIRCRSPLRTPSTIELFDVSGRVVRRLHDGVVGAREAEVSWDGRDDAGRDLPAGLYLVRVTTPVGATNGRVVLTR